MTSENVAVVSTILVLKLSKALSSVRGTCWTINIGIVFNVAFKV